MRWFLLLLMWTFPAFGIDQCDAIWGSAFNQQSNNEPDRFDSNGNSLDVGSHQTHTGNEFIYDTLLVKKNRKLTFQTTSGNTVYIYVNQLKLEEGAKLNLNENVNLIVIAKSDIVFEKKADAVGLFYSKTKVELKGSNNGQKATVKGAVSSPLVTQEFSSHVTYDASQVSNSDLSSICTVASSNNVPTDMNLSEDYIDAATSSVGSAVGIFTSTDADSGETFSYDLISSGTTTDAGACTSSVGNSIFQISTDELQAAGVLTAGTYNICVRTTDSQGATYKETFKITAGDACTVIWSDVLNSQSTAIFNITQDPSTTTTDYTLSSGNSSLAAGTHVYDEMDVSLSNLNFDGTDPVVIYVRSFSALNSNINLDTPNPLIIVATEDLSVVGTNIYAAIYTQDSSVNFTTSSLTGAIASNQILSIPYDNNDNGANNLFYDAYYHLGAGINSECDVAAAIDHFLIVHDSIGLTCTSETVTVKACNNADCSSLSTASVSFDLQGNGVNKASSTITGSGSVSFSHTTAETLTLSLGNLSMSGNNNLVCDDSNNGTSCDVTFADAGYIVTIPDFVSSSKSYAQVNGGTVATVQAVRTDNASQSCVPGYTGSQNVNVALSYTNPSNGGLAVAFSNDNSTYVDLTTTISTSLNFSVGSATAHLYLAYPDVGQLGITITDPNNVLISGGVATGTDNFVVYPANLQITATDLSDSDLNGGAHIAGQPFKLNIQAVNVDGNVTPNYAPGALEINPTMLSSMPDAAKSTLMFYSNQADDNILTSKGDNWTSANVTFTNGIYSTSSASFDDVGEFQIDVRDTYMTHGINTTGAVGAGRFTPAYFVIEQIDAPRIADSHTPNLAGILAGETPFSYIGEDLSYETKPKYRVVAKNFKNATTNNYDEVFNKFTGADVFNLALRSYSENNAGVTIFNSDTTSNPITLEDETNWDGTFEFIINDTFDYTKEASAVAPIDVDITLTLAQSDFVDGDGIGYKSDSLSDLTISSITGTQVRYARVNMKNAFGPEDKTLPVPSSIEYWDGTRYVVNTHDDVTDFSGWSWVLSGDNSSDFEINLDTNPSSTYLDGETDTTFGIFAKPVAGKGDVIAELTLTLSNIPAHLKYDWNGDDSVDDTQTSTLIFGRYRGHDRIIYKHER